MSKSLVVDCKHLDGMQYLCRGRGLLPNDTGSWEGANSDICVAISGLTDRLLALVLGLSPLPCAGAGKGEEEEEKAGKEWGKRKRTGKEEKMASCLWS